MCMRSNSSTRPCRFSKARVRYTVTRLTSRSSLRAWRRIWLASRCCFAVSTTLRIVRRWCVIRTPREVSSAWRRPGVSVCGSGIRVVLKPGCNYKPQAQPQSPGDFAPTAMSPPRGQGFPRTSRAGEYSWADKGVRPTGYSDCRNASSAFCSAGLSREKRSVTSSASPL